MTLSVAPWAVYEFDGNNIDSVGNGPTLNEFATTYGTGRTGQGIQSFSMARKFTPLPFPNFVGDISVCLWYQTRAEDIADFGSAAFELTSGLAFAKGMYLNINYEASGFTFEGQINNKVFSVNFSPIGSAGWHFITVTKTADGAVNIMQDTLSRHTDTMATGTLNGNDQLSISSADGAVGPRLDQLSIFQGILTADDVTYLYNSGTGRAYTDWEIAAAESSVSIYRKHMFLTT